MNETHVTVVGNVATRVEFRTTASGVPLARFRLASTVRRFDPQERVWSDAGTSFYTVWARRGLAENVASSVMVGEPVIVTGQFRIQESARDGQHYVSAELSASSVGHDLSRGTSAFVRVSPARRGLTGNGGSAAGDESLPGVPEPAAGVAEPNVPGQSAGP
ncbi:single-stranded DNA-binding protein [Streptomyces sp. WMMB 322]|uniref:single-stranded DNA-binding protein n=1 Tax=Streptomyces sp. WMMB 322 TaxID=1286821 RepID=UPI0006E37668|nr:single-stranded DNA-binding protein [Streptomyces sp. WMMB 322]SCK18614.1 single-strand DNA-binding protein [Streptomyces sp. WMMB 322]